MLSCAAAQAERLTRFPPIFSHILYSDENFTYSVHVITSHQVVELYWHIGMLAFSYQLTVVLSTSMFAVMYFLFVMILCVMSLGTTILVMYLENRCVDKVPIPVMPHWVRASLLCCILDVHIVPIQTLLSPPSPTPSLMSRTINCVANND